MKKKPIPKATAVAVMLAFAGTAGIVMAAEDTVVTETVSVKCILPSNLEAVPGSFSVVEEEELQVRQPFSVQEAQNYDPGINMNGENNFGMGVHIGVRWLDPRSTSRTLLMENGMPLYLAPFGDPSAHNTTPMER